MQLIPNSNREDNAPTHLLRLREFNKCHNPKGAGGGRFCSMGPDQAYPRYPYVPTAAGRLLEGYPDPEVAGAASAGADAADEEHGGDRPRVHGGLPAG